MTKGKVFACEVTVSSGVKENLLMKHNIEIWEIEEVIYDDPHAFSLAYQDCYFIYGQSFSGRYLLVLVRILSPKEAIDSNFESGTNVIKIITARDVNQKQRRLYSRRKGSQ
ncbi:hypothetical protein JY97_05040 [Alkalispirochaeta odontotermitis]|nr:hypothetical protein JY97_05040 [Alkalispirochaeta odontotermitis]CAB1081532.1 hypothetical protein D1AOALGA4SA_9182 [Olavius algarvensis Delta 1 endosymbiont]